MDTLDCERAQRLIHLKLDGELREDDARVLAEHIGDCQGCRQLQEELEHVTEALRAGLGAIKPPELSTADVCREVRQARRSKVLWSTWLPAAAVFLLMATFVLVAAPRLRTPMIASAAPATVISGGDAMHVFEPDEKTAQSRRTGTVLQEDSVAWGLGGDPIALEFLDGARVGLSNEAVVRIGRNSIDLYKGGLRVDLTGAGEDFSVITPWGEFTGPGSLFMVHSDAEGGSARITVVTGEVTVISRGTEQVLTEGDSQTLKPDPDRTIAA